MEAITACGAVLLEVLASPLLRGHSVGDQDHTLSRAPLPMLQWKFDYRGSALAWEAPLLPAEPP